MITRRGLFMALAALPFAKPAEKVYGRPILEDVKAMIRAMEADKRYGPYVVYGIRRHGVMSFPINWEKKI